MATCYSQILLWNLSIFCLLIIPETKALIFNLTSIGPQCQNEDITTSSDAYISPQGLQVTSDEQNTTMKQLTGKATYIEPLRLWDKSTGNLTDFYTHFTFVIDSGELPKFADGLAFFLAPNGSMSTSGGAMGLPIDPVTIVHTSPFVAVEFDTYQDFPGWDPANITPVTHVGISVNSLRSNVTAIWYANITHGIQNEAWIRYDSSSYNLSVVFTGSTNTTRVEDTIHLVIDLRDYLPEWVTFGFSAATGALFEKHTVKSWEFSSSLQSNEANKTVTPPVKPRPKNLFPVDLVGLVVGSAVLLGGLVLVGFGLWKRSRAKADKKFDFEMSVEREFKSSIGPKKFTYDQLSFATNHFVGEQKLGEGGFGGVYRGFLTETNSDIAVKRISKGSKQGKKEYTSEVNIIGRLRHRNLVQLIGWCHEKEELLLVYEFMENGSLDSHLFTGKSLLAWQTRYKIAKDLALALRYLHEEWEQCVVHRDVKSSNVMLDSHFNAKLGDFGFARLVDHEKESQTTMTAGTMGYVAPECVITGKANKESDVYSFGVVALELACGRRAIWDEEGGEDETGSLVEWVWGLYGRKMLLNAADIKLREDFDRNEMERLLVLGLWCAHPDSKHRPSIKEAIQVLNFEAPTPRLPSVMPAAIYSTPAFITDSSSLPLSSDDSHCPEAARCNL